MINGYILKKPGKGRRTFQLIPYRRVNNKKLYSSSIENPELNALNESLKRGTLTAAEVELEIKSKILPELKRRANIPTKVAIDSLIGEHNMKVFLEFWKKEYRRKRLENPRATKDEFYAALKILEPLSLHSCDVDELQDHWDEKEEGKRHKRYGGRINQLLRHLGRGFTIETDSVKPPPLRWVTWLELEKILLRVQNPELCDLYRSLYGTGARLGEMLAISPSDVRDNGSIFINKQIDEFKQAKAYTKNKRDHDTIILPEAIEAVKRWSKVKDKASYRSRCYQPLAYAARDTFTDVTKHISPHKLRHSYVKQMLLLGVPLDRLSQLLGDNLATVESTYRQWRVTDPEIDYIKSIMDAGLKRLKKD